MKTKRSKNPMDWILHHRVNIAKKTLKMNDVFARIMGGMTKDEARKVLLDAGFTEKEISKMEE